MLIGSLLRLLETTRTALTGVLSSGGSLSRLLQTTRTALAGTLSFVGESLGVKSAPGESGGAGAVPFGGIFSRWLEAFRTQTGVLSSGGSFSRIIEALRQYSGVASLSGVIAYFVNNPGETSGTLGLTGSAQRGQCLFYRTLNSVLAPIQTPTGEAYYGEMMMDMTLGV